MRAHVHGERKNYLNIIGKFIPNPVKVSSLACKRWEPNSRNALLVII
jgi:hypothetical protein